MSLPAAGPEQQTGPAGGTLPVLPEVSAHVAASLQEMMGTSGPNGNCTNGGKLSGERKRMLDYAVANSGGARIKLAVDGGAQLASNFIVNGDETVIGMGGFMGTDLAPSLSDLEKWTKSGELRFVAASGNGGPGGIPALPGLPGSQGGLPELAMGNSAVAIDRGKWLEDNCTKVDETRYGGRSTNGQAAATANSLSLYDCAPRH